MKKSPLFSIHYYSLGNELIFTGGIAGEYWSFTESNIINSVNLIYLKNKRDNKWFLAEFKKRNFKRFREAIFKSCHKISKYEKGKFCGSTADKSNSLKSNK